MFLNDRLLCSLILQSNSVLESDKAKKDSS